MSSVGRAVSGTAGRLLTRPREPHDDFVLCAADGFWFRPAYTEGKCPLCGDPAPGGEPPLPLTLRIDRLSLGLVSFALMSLAMSILVLLMYYKT